jgi:uncharacterized protein (DUF488 family)
MSTVDTDAFPPMHNPFYTIGHSTRPRDQFIAILSGAKIDFVVDIRSIPRSRTNPQYNADVLLPALNQVDIGYEHIAALGGLRSRQPQVPPEVNGFWQNTSFHNYADYAMSDGFQHGLARLLQIGRVHSCAMMCAELLWWRCHRRIVADYLLSAGEAVFHIMRLGEIVPAHITESGKVAAPGRLTYPAPVQPSAAGANTP